MVKRNAIYWLIPTVIILLLHTLVPHTHHVTTEIKKNTAITCHHGQHDIWEFFEHLLLQDGGYEHLENYQVSKVGFDKQDFNFSTLFITNNFSFFYPLTTSKTIHKIIPFNDFIFPKNRFINDISFRGPPILV